MVQRRILGVFDRLFFALSSLKLAVLVILSLAFSMGTATVLESLYDTPTAQYWIYRSGWFHSILALLGVNILCVALSRYPWKKKHFPFLLAHAGILILLIGSWMTDQWGVDGNLRVTEGEIGRVVELDSASWVISEGEQTYSLPVRWLPPGVAFQALKARSLGLSLDLQVDRFLSHADPIVSFIPNLEPSVSSKKSLPALRLRMAGGPMGISQEIWLWEGAEDWKSFQAGPARITWGDSASRDSNPLGRPSVVFQFEKGILSFIAQSSEGKKVRGRIQKNQIAGYVIHPGWKGNVTLTLEEWIPHAMASTHYQSARVQYGSQAPTSAIHLVGPDGVELWLGLGDRASLHIAGRDVDVGYFPKRIVLPFGIRLDRFTVEHDQGTLSPASYASRVTVWDGKGQKDVTISMNEPLEMGVYTIYQASYEEGDPRPVTSIFAVNQDPGRECKYLGSFLIVLGSILLFGVKYKRSWTSRKKRIPLSSYSSTVSEASS